ncbi:hypothetical protein BJY52DRAFT_1304651 [Lactarius psammicola]|nr:hypothetical protein BJY52DRAFT_1304651 [Lactarius psammicola]
MGRVSRSTWSSVISLVLMVPVMKPCTHPHKQFTWGGEVAQPRREARNPHHIRHSRAYSQADSVAQPPPSPHATYNA